MNRVFKEWIYFIDKYEAERLLPILVDYYNAFEISPKKEDVFKAFSLCNPNDCKVVFIGQDPYPQRGVATGILFGNKQGTKEDDYSPSLKVIKESINNLENSNIVYTFDPTLENWAKQGILMLNASLTVEVNRIGSHTMLWRRFIARFINNFSKYNNNIVWVLFGELAQTFAPYIFQGKVFKVKHPAYYARINKKMPCSIFNKVNDYLSRYNTKIDWCNV